MQNLIWEKKYGGSQAEQGFTLIFDSSTKDIFFIGSGWSKDGDMWDASPNLNNPEISSTLLTWVMRLDSIGNKKWSRVYGPLGDNPSYFASCHIQENEGGGIMKNGQLYIYCSVAGRDDTEIGESIGGGDKTDLWLIILDTANGNIYSRTRLGAQCADVPRYIKGSSYNNDIYLGARTSGFAPIDTPINLFGCHFNNFATTSFVSLTLGYWPNHLDEKLKKSKLLKVYPNPAKDVITVEREILDQTYNDLTYKIIVYSKDGRMTYESILLPKQNKMKISTSKWSRGLYFIRYEGNGVKCTEQVIID
ncbi:MAG: T9SS type A sorting domain-containing protein [Bacteroidetes bacterium]|nr:T9SS type A sorting domain-containing protein [Bacteroidota bacterium]